MNDVVAVNEGGYGYLPGGATPFSNGVVALPGHMLTRVRFRRPLPLAEGLAWAASFISGQERPLSSLAACELRAPAPLSRQDFGAFNGQYTESLRANGFSASGPYPIARSNMAPLFSPPGTNTLFAFTFAAPADAAADGSRSDFLISGKPESLNGPPYVLAAGATSPAAMALKAHYVVEQLQARVRELGADWDAITGAQAYTIHSLDGVMDALRSSGLGNVGLALFPAYPPVIGLDFEIDVRSISVERAV